ncbi:hypothetical protein LAW88_17505 [Escherichia coli]|nr:hypothetical protein [Escherichia coli]MDD9008755.1 hypothetical protein [Escherichia coli]
MTFDEKELDNAINKIIVTSLFSCLSDTQQKQFYESAFNMIERCCFCDADELPEKIRKQLADALRVRLYAVNLFVAGMAGSACLLMQSEGLFTMQEHDQRQWRITQLL